MRPGGDGGQRGAGGDGQRGRRGGMTGGTRQLQQGLRFEIRHEHFPVLQSNAPS